MAKPSTKRARYSGVLAKPMECALQGRYIHPMCQRVEPSFGFPLRSFHYLQKFR